MFATITAIVAIFVIVLTAIARSRKSRHGLWVYERVFGVYFAAGKWVGNCFSPAVVVEWYGVKKPHSSHDPLNMERIAKLSESSRLRMIERYEQRMQEPEIIGYAAWGMLTLRFNGAETKFYWRGWYRVDWSSEHIARKWGTAQDAPHGTCWFYKGWLGSHAYV